MIYTSSTYVIPEYHLYIVSCRSMIYQVYSSVSYSGMIYSTWYIIPEYDLYTVYHTGVWYTRLVYHTGVWYKQYDSTDKRSYLHQGNTQDNTTPRTTFPGWFSRQMGAVETQSDASTRDHIEISRVLININSYFQGPHFRSGCPPSSFPMHEANRLGNSPEGCVILRVMMPVCMIR